MFCPACKGEFREGFTVCNTCNIGLVEDLNNLPDKIEGEFRLCVKCEKKYDDNETHCPECGLKLVRALENEDGYILLEEPDFENASQTQKYDLSEYEHCIDLSEEPTEVLLESEDMEIMHEIMLLLDEEGFDFGFVTPYEQPNLLGSVFGENTPLARSFPKIVVRSEDIQAATDLLNNSELGLFDIPEELRDPDELKDLDESEEEPEDVDL